MSKFSDTVKQVIADVMAFVVGWVFCLAMVMGFYTIGYFVGPYLLRDGILDSGMIDRHTIGLLSVIVSIWLYEHQRTDARWDRLNQIMGR